MKIRIKFSKHGVLKYIGHLDLMRYFQKAFRRTDINVCYSKGFSPHMIMSFAAPLGVGVESDGEYFDVEVEASEDLSLIKDKLNATMAEGIKVLGVYKLPEKSINAMASVQAASYEIKFADSVFLPDTLKSTYMEAEKLTYIKSTKTKDTEINVKEFTFDFNIINNSIFITVDASSANNLKPANFCLALFNGAGLNIEDYPYHIFRIDTYKRNESGNLVPLSDV